MTKIKKIIAVLLCVLTLFSIMSTSVYAATSGGNNTKTISVSTKSNWFKPGSESITLKQYKTKYYAGHNAKCYGGTCECSLNRRENGYYGYYKITIYNSTDKKTTYKYWDGGQTCKIKLGRNKTYKITVAYINNETIANCQANWNKGNGFLRQGGITKVHRAACSWYVSSTNKVSSYS